MLADRRADIVRRLSEPLRAQLCAELEEPLRRSLLELLAYPHGTAGAIMTTELVTVDVDWTAARALEHIRSVGAGSETIYAIYVVDPASRQLLRALSLRQLILADPQARVAEIGPARRPLTHTPWRNHPTIRRCSAAATPAVRICSPVSPSSAPNTRCTTRW